MGRVAFIPARGGSKRLPRKNILPVSGRPAIAYPIRAALDSGLFDEVFVSTEDREIADVATAHGASIIERPDDLARDRSTVVQVCGHALDLLESEGRLPAEFCCLYATAIFLTAQDLIESHGMLETGPRPDFVMGVAEYNLQVMQALHEEDGFLKPRFPDEISRQSQFQPNFVASCGMLYWARTEAFRQTRSFYGEKLRGYVIPRVRACDLDTPADYELAQAMAEFVFSTSRGQD